VECILEWMRMSEWVVLLFLIIFGLALSEDDESLY
jgi:hypothetical protein